MTRILRPAVGPALAVALWALPWPARAVSPEERKTEDAVKVLRGLKDPGPEDFARQVGEGADRVLVNLLVARKVDLEVRMKACRALARFPGERARRVLSSLIPNPDEPLELRGQAMESLADHQGPRVAQDLLPWLRDPHPELRASASRAIGRTGDPAACQTLEDLLGTEEVLEVRVAVEQGLALCRRERRP